MNARIKSIKIDKRRDVIIVDADGPNLQAGRRFFCGCCGKLMGINSTPLNFPFQDTMLFKSFGDTCTVTRNFFGLRHKTCGHIIAGCGSLTFISVTTYFRDRSKNK